LTYECAGPQKTKQRWCILNKIKNNSEFDEASEDQAPATELETIRQEAELGTLHIIQETIQPLYGLLETAITDSATDIHFDPVGDHFFIRFRINGIIRNRGMIPQDEAKQMLLQLRAYAGMGISKTFTALESQCKWLGEEVVKDIRVTIVPIGGTVSAHLRILTPPEFIKNIENLGLEKKDASAIRRHLSSAQGLVVVGGPTGAGKTTTIYSLANMFDLESIIGVSIEDPIEFDIPYMRQLEVDTRHDLLMPEGLRALLRMDPDLLMVTEIRDEQSAITVARAATAASLILSTIHSGDAAGAVEAFHFFNVPCHILGSCLRVIIAQNLVRALCPECKISRNPTKEDRELFERWDVTMPDEIFDPRTGGCGNCDHYGFYGRTGIFEVVEVDEEVRKAIISGTSPMDLRKKFRNKGFSSIFQNGLYKVAAGDTSMKELLDLYWPDFGGSGID